MTGAPLWIEQAYVIPRYLSFLLAPLFILLATGAAALLQRLPGRPALVRTAVCLVAVVILGARFVVVAPDVVALPREAHRDVAEAIKRGPPGTPVVAYMRNPSNLEFYLGRSVAELRADTVVRRVCDELARCFSSTSRSPSTMSRSHAWPGPALSTTGFSVCPRGSDGRLVRAASIVSARRRRLVTTRPPTSRLLLASESAVVHPQGTVIEADAKTSPGPEATMSDAIGRDRVSVVLRGQETKALLAIAYTALGAGLVLSRVVGLDHGFWLDEAVFVENYVREGPREILTGAGLSHELYGLIGWAISSVFGESEIALRLCSVVPFVVGVGLVTAWLHRRVHAVAGLFYLLLATASPLLLDITRSARGYGLAFCAMSFLVIAALEAGRTGRDVYVAVVCVAGVIGTWTLPQFGFAFVGVGASLLADRRLRRSSLVGLVASLAAIVVWYAPHFGQVEESSQIPQGIQISPEWLLTAPLDQVLLPALIWIDGVVVVPGPIWLPLIGGLVAILGSSPLLRERSVRTRSLRPNRSHGQRPLRRSCVRTAALHELFARADVHSAQ